MYYFSNEKDTQGMTGKTFESHLKENNTAKKAKLKGGKDWMDEEISLLIDMLEEKLCLWNVFDKEYTKRDVKEIVYTEIPSSLDRNIQSIKAKNNGLRAQRGREVAKVIKKKSGQNTDELYASSWIHYDCLSFHLSVIKDTLKPNNEEENEEVEETRLSTPGLKKKTIAERKIELLSKCTEAITKKPVESAFALYVDEKRSQLGKRRRRIPEKCISGVLFELKLKCNPKGRSLWIVK